MAKQILFNLTDNELAQYLENMGQPKFRAKQIREWLLRGAPDFASMKNIPETLRNDLDAVAQTLPSFNSNKNLVVSPSLDSSFCIILTGNV